MNAKPARILIIAGSDSSGGAGIQADIKTATALGCYAMTAITAVTAQNTSGVQAIHPVPASIVREQITACLDDIGADAIKIGMLGDADIVETVAGILALQAPGIPVVLDPVMVAKGGASLLQEQAIAALKKQLIPLASVITPNAPEAATLTGVEVKVSQDSVASAHVLIELGAKAALVKGGHLQEDVVMDILVEQALDKTVAFGSNRIETRHTHGTGCTLSTAIACGLGQGMPLTEAVERAHAYVQEAIRAAPGFGAGHGPLNHMHGKVR